MSVKLWRSTEEEWVADYYITRVKTGSQSVGDHMSWREDAGLRNMSQRGWAPMPPVEQPGELERNTVIANRVGVDMLQFCLVSNSLSHTTLSMKWEVYFSKELCRSSLLCRRYDSACICIRWLYNMNMSGQSESQPGGQKTLYFAIMLWLNRQLRWRMRKNKMPFRKLEIDLQALPNNKLSEISADIVEKKMECSQINHVQNTQRETHHCQNKAQSVIWQKQHGAGRAY